MPLGHFNFGYYRNVHEMMAGGPSAMGCTGHGSEERLKQRVRILHKHTN